MHSTTKALVATLTLVASLLLAGGVNAHTFPDDANGACADGAVGCKEVTEYTDADGDGLVEVGEMTDFNLTMTVTNDSGADMNDITVKDHFSASLELNTSAWMDVSHGIAGFTQKGANGQYRLTWDIGTLADGESATLIFNMSTDQTPDGMQSFDHCGLWEFNSGVTTKWTTPKENGKGVQKHSSWSGSIMLNVWTEDMAGDCDEDGLSDADEHGDGNVWTDPFNADTDGDGVLDGSDMCLDQMEDGLGDFPTDGCPDGTLI